MASIIKLDESDIVGICRHDNRDNIEHNIQYKVHIDATRTHLNEDLTPIRTEIKGKKNPEEIKLSKLQYLHRRLKVLPHMKRKNLKVGCEWVVTLPKEIRAGSDEDRAFFKATYDFLCGKYGTENVITANIHRDEAQPHLHFCFIPVDARGRICAKNITKLSELYSFHPQLQDYLTKQGIKCNVNSGITRAQGGNRTIAELKKGAKTHEENHKIIRNKRQSEREHGNYRNR